MSFSFVQYVTFPLSAALRQLCFPGGILLYFASEVTVHDVLVFAVASYVQQTSASAAHRLALVFQMSLFTLKQ